MIWAPSYHPLARYIIPWALHDCQRDFVCDKDMIVVVVILFINTFLVALVSRGLLVRLCNVRESFARCRLRWVV